ncbi:MAG: hypothetical protein LH628_12965, partial [Microcoleus sp. CAN_BIN18]|nr:hypothetical protein [Microcoleus sp. CAN_BIN18]
FDGIKVNWCAVHTLQITKFQAFLALKSKLSTHLDRTGRSPYEMATLHAKSVQSSPFEMVEMDRIVSGKRGWVTRGLREYVGWAMPRVGFAYALQSEL